MHQHEHDKLISTVVDTVVRTSVSLEGSNDLDHDDMLLHRHTKTIQNISTGAARPRPLIMPTLPTRSKEDCSHFRLGPSTWFPWKLE